MALFDFGKKSTENKFSYDQRRTYSHGDSDNSSIIKDLFGGNLTLNYGTSIAGNLSYGNTKAGSSFDMSGDSGNAGSTSDHSGNAGGTMDVTASVGVGVGGGSGSAGSVDKTTDNTSPKTISGGLNKATNAISSATGLNSNYFKYILLGLGVLLSGGFAYWYLKK